MSAQNDGGATHYLHKMRRGRVALATPSQPLTDMNSASVQMADQTILKTCSSCNLNLEIVNFSKHPPNKDGYRGQCKRCRSLATGAYVAREGFKRKPRPSMQRRWQEIFSKYGLREKQYNEMLERQGGGCAICGSKDPRSSRNVFVIDHCHEANAVRGLLCTRCNSALGIFGDGVKGFRRVLEYLSGPHLSIAENKKNLKRVIHFASGERAAQVFGQRQ